MHDVYRIIQTVVQSCHSTLACCMASIEPSLSVMPLLSGDESGTPEPVVLDASCASRDSERDASALRSVSKSAIFFSRLSSQDLLERSCLTNLFSLCTSLSSARLASSKERSRPEWRVFEFAAVVDLHGMSCRYHMSYRHHGMALRNKPYLKP